MEPVELSFDVYENEETKLDLCPIIVIHGLIWSKFMLADVGLELSRKTNRKVFCLDMRNHGDSPASEHCDSSLMIADVKKFMRDQDLPKVVFVCHDFSITIAYSIAMAEPESVEKMIWVDSSYYQIRTPIVMQQKLLTTLNSKMNIRQAKEKFNSLLENGDKRFQQECVIRKASNELVQVDGIFKYKVDIDFIVKRYGEKAFNPEIKGSPVHKILFITCPDYLEASKTRYEEIVKDSANTKFVKVEGTTQSLMYERARKFVDLTKDFLNSLW